MDRKEYDKMDGDIKMASGLCDCINKKTGEKKFSFWSEIDFRGKPQLAIQSCKEWSTEKEAQEALEDFVMKFPMALLKPGGVEALIDKYEMAHMYPEKKTKLTLVKDQ